MAFPAESTSFLAPLAPWFEAHRRALPWRALDLDQPHPDPYGVLVSELMLQQTQVATVVPYFERWMKALPDIQALAQAPEDQVHKLWEGLGYYRRARFLQAAAKAIQAQGWPKDLEGLSALPGLGPYTAAALAAIAFQWPEPALDGNAFRVLARLLKIEADPKARASELRAWLRPALVAHGPSRLTQALMELGASHCARRAQCGFCPMKDRCLAWEAGLVDQIPPVAIRAKVRQIEVRLMALRAGDRFLVNAPAPSGLLAGLWGWPFQEAAPPGISFAAETTREYSTVNVQELPGWTQVYTHRRETIHPLLMDVAAPFSPADTQRWVSAQELEALPMGKRDQRLRDLVLRGKPRTSLRT